MDYLARPGLPPGAYTDPAILEQEKALLLRRNWQWAGMLEDTAHPGGLKATIAEMPLVIDNSGADFQVWLDLGTRRELLEDASAAVCGRFLFVHLAPEPAQTLENFLGDYADALRHASAAFNEVYDSRSQIWQCNWKAGLEIALEGYHVPVVHAASEFGEAVPVGVAPSYNGPHSFHVGMMGAQMEAEMANIAKRLKIRRSEVYRNYDHFTLFPNMAFGFSGGCLCFMQIYSPCGTGQMELRYAYLLGRLEDPAQQPTTLIKKSLLTAWRTYTDNVLSEDRVACERFQRGVTHAMRPGVAGKLVEEQVIHFQTHWRKRMDGQT